MNRSKLTDIGMVVALVVGFTIAVVTNNTGNVLIFTGLTLVSQAHFFKKIKSAMTSSGRLIYIIGFIWALSGIPVDLPLALGWSSVFLTLLVGTYVSMKKLTPAEQSHKDFRDKVANALTYIEPIPTKCWGDHKPKRGSNFAAGIDLYNNGESVSLVQGQTAVISTKTAMAIPHGHVGLVFPRSSFGFLGLTLINSTGVIDSDYRGEILVKVILGTSDGSENINQMYIDNGTRFAQIVIVPVLMADIKLVDELSDTVRGKGGVGSTGLK